MRGGRVQEGMKRWLACAAVVVLVSAAFAPAAAQSSLSSNRCANSQPYNATSNTCSCNQDAAAGATFRGVSCQLASRECGGGVYCVNSGTCEKLFNTDAYQCNCPAGTRGANCQVVVDDCGGGSYCTNGGTCQRLNNVEGGSASSSICICPTGYVGEHCEVDASAVNAAVCGPQVYCLNGGECNDAGTACVCAAGFTGSNCGQARTDAASGSTEVAASPSSGSGSGGSTLSGGAIAGIVIAAVVVAALAACIAILIWRERRGKPVFVPFHDDEHGDSRRVITNAQLSKQFAPTTDSASSGSPHRPANGGSPV